MRAKFWTVAVTVLLFLTACEKEIKAPDPITVMVTIDYGNGKIVKFIYHDKLVWQSEPNVTGIAYHQAGDLVYLSFTAANGDEKSLIFQDGELTKGQ